MTDAQVLCLPGGAIVALTLVASNLGACTPPKQPPPVEPTVGQSSAPIRQDSPAPPTLPSAATTERRRHCEPPAELGGRRCRGGEGKVSFCSFAVTKDLKLEPGCAYRMGLRLRRPGVELDCQGATLDGAAFTRVESFGIDVRSWKPGIPRDGSKPISIRNCKIVGFERGVRLRNQHFKGKDGGEALYRLSPVVRLERVDITKSGEVGLHILPFVEDALFKDGTVEDAEGPGIYISPWSRKNRIENNLIRRNGRNRDKGSNRRREGIAVDGSSDNVFAGNRFEGNIIGDITLYRNCGEHGTFLRPPARNNEIRGNTFGGSPVAIWIASRQSDGNIRRFKCPAKHSVYAEGTGKTASWSHIARPTTPDCQCGDPTGLPKKATLGRCSRKSLKACPARKEGDPAFDDQVLDTLVRENVFLPLRTQRTTGGKRVKPRAAVIVEDDGTTLLRNAFVGYGAKGPPSIIVGTPLRYYNLGLPVRNTRIEDTGFVGVKKKGFEKSISYRHGSQPPRLNPPPRGTQAACKVGDVVIPPKASHRFFATPSAPCRSELRTCEAGQLSGSFTEPTCAP